MNPISNVNGTMATAQIAQQQGGRDLGPGQVEYRRQADEVEISEVGVMLSRLRELPDIRSERIAQIRAEIESGTFETQARIDGTVDALLEEWE